MKFNMFCVIGRLVEIKKIDKKYSAITLRAQSEDEDKTLLFTILIGTPLFSKINNYVPNESLMGIHGFFSNDEKGNIQLIADKITFMAPKAVIKND